MTHHSQHWAKALAIGALMLIAWALVIHMGWNMAMPDIFEFEPIRFKQALGLTLLIAAATFPFTQRAHKGWHRRDECPAEQAESV